MSKANVRRLLSAIVDHYRCEVRAGCDGYPLLQDALQAIASTPYPRTAMREEEEVRRVALPVQRFVATLPDDGALAPLMARFKAAEPVMDWLRNPNYTADRLGAGFMENAGMVELVGPSRMFRSPSTRVGLALLGPGVEYPDHRHPAAEVCHVISGTAEWWREDGDWQSLGPGTAIYHLPGQRHAVRTKAEPMLALYCWRGDVQTDAYLAGSADETAQAAGTATPKAKGKRGRS